jgi:uncharacterized protein (TIGR01370 family)
MATPVNGIYVLQGIVPSQIAAARVGVKVVDLYDDNGNLFSTTQVAQMKSGGGKVLGYFSIGEAENYHSYWSSLPTSVLGPQDPSWPGDYQVAYWTPQWLTVSENYIQTMINQGYDGAYFDVVNEAEQSWAISHVPGGTLAAAEGAMVTLIEELANFAHAKDPNFKIWINSSGAEDMLAANALDKTIDGAYEEQLFYQTATQPTKPADLSYNLAYLDDLVKAGKPVVAIEYVSGASEVSSVETQAKADGLGYYIANPNQQLNGVDTQGLPTPPNLKVADSTLSVTAHGGTVNLGISVSAPVSSTATTVKITGLPSYETITDKYDGKTFTGASITLSEAEVDRGLTLTSLYQGSGHPSAKLTVTASDTIGGITSVSTPKTITVNDPPSSGSTATADALPSKLFEFEPSRESTSVADFWSLWSGTSHMLNGIDATVMTSERNAGFDLGSQVHVDESLPFGLNIATLGGHTFSSY